MEKKQKYEQRRHNDINRTISILQKNNYEWIDNLGAGTFGTVVALKNRSSEKVVAAKIVLEDMLTYPEVEIWPSLSHGNVVTVINFCHLPQSRAYVFFMPKYRGSLDDILEATMLNNEKKGFQRALAWLYGVLKGVLYLHKKKLCHLDLKLQNILINDSDEAVVTDFGSLTRTNAAANKYASPFIYRPPEAPLLKNGKRIVVHGFKYDSYTIGILAAEVFTKQMILKTEKRRDPDRTWTDTIYPVIFSILEKKQLKKFLKASFLKSDVGSKTFEDIRNFIIGCIMINPRNRPTVETLLKHRLFQGYAVFKVKKNDIWQVKAQPNRINFLISLFIGQAAALRLPPDPSDYLQADSENKNVRSNQELKANQIHRKHADEIVDQTKMIPNNQQLKSNKINSKDVSEVLGQPDIAENNEKPKARNMNHKYVFKVSDERQVAVNNQKSSEMEHNDVEKVFDQQKFVRNCQTPKPKPKETRHKGGNEVPDQAANSEEPKANKINRKYVSKVFDERQVAANNQKSSEIEHKDVDEVSDQQKFVTNSEKPKPNETGYKGGSDVPDHAKISVNNKEPELNKIDRKAVNEILDQVTIDSISQKPDLNDVNTKDSNKASDQLNIDSNSQEGKPNDIKHYPDVALTRRQHILAWGRRTKSRVTNVFSRLLRRSKK